MKYTAEFLYTNRPSTVTAHAETLEQPGLHSGPAGELTVLPRPSHPRHV